MNDYLRYLIRPNYVFMTLLQLMLPLFVYLAWGVEWGWWVVAGTFYFIHLAIGNNIGMHRYFCHRYFKAPLWAEWLMLWASASAALGSPISYAGIHVIHHKHSDTDLDPHGPQRGWKSVLYCFHRKIQPTEISFSRNLGTLMTKYSWLHNYYWGWVVAYALGILFVGGIKPFLFIWAIPVSATLWAVALVLLLQHDDKQASNTQSYQWFGWGEAFHKNHHDDPKLTNHAPVGKVDWTYQMTKWLSL